MLSLGLLGCGTTAPAPGGEAVLPRATDESPPTEARRLLEEGQRALAAGDHLAAAAAFRGALDLEPTMAEATLGEARALEREANDARPRPAGDTERLRRRAVEAYLAAIDQAQGTPLGEAARRDLGRLARSTAQRCLTGRAGSDEALFALVQASRHEEGAEADELRGLTLEVGARALAGQLRSSLDGLRRVAVLQPAWSSAMAGRGESLALERLGQLLAAQLAALHHDVTVGKASALADGALDAEARASLLAATLADAAVVVVVGQELVARLVALSDGRVLAHGSAPNPLHEQMDAEEQLATYQRTPFDATREPFHVLVYGGGSGATRAEALSAAQLSARAEAATACATHVQVDLRRVTLEGATRLDEVRLRHDVSSSERRIVARSEAVLREALPRPGSVVYRPGREGGWECHLQLAVPSVDLLPMKTLDDTLRLPDDQVINEAQRLATTLEAREHYGLLGALHAALARRFPRRAEHHLAHAAVLSDHLGLHLLAHQVLQRGLALAQEFDAAGGRAGFEAMAATFTQRVFDWSSYRHQVEDLLDGRRDADGGKLTLSKAFPDRLRVRPDTQLAFSVATDAPRYVYFLWFDAESLGFAPESGARRQGVFTYRCTPGTVDSDVLLVVIAGDEPWATAPLRRVFERARVDAREAEEAAGVRQFLGDLDDYMSRARGVAAMVSFRQVSGGQGQ